MTNAQVINLHRFLVLAEPCWLKAMHREKDQIYGYGLVVMTLASHARGRGFEPPFPYEFC